ncbi:hypothetical protein EMCRGX_G008443 [Ephydatia muelleri]
MLPTHKLSPLRVQLCLPATCPARSDNWYWHSSAAYAIASEVECGGKDSIPPQGHEVYRWPRDLFKPDVSAYCDSGASEGVGM